MSTTQHQAMKRARDFLATYAPPEWADAETLVAMLYAARIERLEKALNRIASWDDGPAVGPNFDEPASAEIARAALEDPVPQFPGAPGAQRAAPAVPSALEAVARNFEFLAPDADGIVWLALHGHGTTGKAMVRVGEHDRLAAQVALHLENDRREALAASTTAPAVPDVVREVDGGPSAKTPLGAMALRLYAAWAKAEPNHGVTKYPVSYWQTFIDMARAVLSASPAAPSAPTANDEPFARPHPGAGDARGEGR